MLHTLVQITFFNHLYGHVKLMIFITILFQTKYRIIHGQHLINYEIRIFGIGIIMCYKMK